jgi:ketosteroid isomerase-like protein
MWLRARLIVALLLAILVVGAWRPNVHRARAEQPVATADETAIRQLIQKDDAGEPIQWTEDRIFASGVTPKPLIGRRQNEEFRSRMEAVRRQRPKSKTKTTAERLVVSKSGDLAYEYSTFRIEWDATDGNRTGFDGSLLRVWRKVDGQWLAEAMFARPNQETPRAEGN